MNDVEQLSDYRRNSAEEGRSRLAFHLVAVALDLNESALLVSHILYNPRGIHLLDIRNEDGGRCPELAGRRAIGSRMYLLRFEELEVTWQGSGV